MKKLIFLTITAIVFTIGVFTAIAVNNRGSAPVAYWKFDEGYGSTAYDAAGSNDGTITNASWRNEEDCKFGKCLYFDGTGDYVDMGNGSNLQITGSLTLEAWVKVNSFASYNAIIAKTSASADRGYRIFTLTDNTFGILISSDGSLYVYRPTSSTYNTGQWYHIAGVYDASAQTLDIYVNGVLDNGTLAGTEVVPSSINNSSQNLLIGNRGNLDYDMNGFIDSPKIYDYARTAAQIKADFLAGAGGRGASVVQSSKFKVQSSSEGLVGYWKMDESSWTVDCATETVMDSSGAGNNGFACPNAGGLAPSSGKFGSAGLFDGTEDYIKIPDIDF